MNTQNNEIEKSIYITKRDGRKVNFNPAKITNAVLQATKKIEELGDEALAKKISKNVSKQIIAKGDAPLSVENIQDMVEMELMNSKRKDVALEYIKYRQKRNIARQAKTRDMFLEIVNAKPNDVTRENANMNADTPAGMMMKFASETTKPFVMDYLISEESAIAHRSGDIHIHDADYMPTKSLTCLQHPLDRILENGFFAGHGESRPAKRIETASILGCISLETVQNEMHGGQAIPALDFYFAPYVRKSFIEELKNMEGVNDTDYSHLYEIELLDYTKLPLDGLKGEARVVQHCVNKTVDRTHQSMEAFIHNLNTIHSRGGNQVVFSSVNYGTCTSAEGRCVIRELLLSTYKGVGNNGTAIFPIQIWKKKRGVNYLESDRNRDLYELACKVSARRFFPNFINLDAPFNKHDKWDINDPKRYEYEPATMGCRTRVFENNFGEKTSIGRGNISFTTINLPRLAIEAAKASDDVKERMDIFYTSLRTQIELVAKQLHERFEFQKTALAKQFPLLMAGLWNGSDKLKGTDNIESVINQGTLGIGFIGLAECLVALIGKHHGESDEAQQEGLKIVEFMKTLTSTYVEKYKHNYSVLATPAEGLSGRFTKLDKEKYGIIEGVTDREYYTNSNHVPVYYNCSVEHKAKIEAPYHDMTRGGHIFYVEIDGDATHNPKAIMDVVDLMDKYNIGYGSVNHTRSRCLECGFENADNEIKSCPKCGSLHVTSIQRITGYLVGTTDRWNGAKQAELRDRVIHK